MLNYRINGPSIKNVIFIYFIETNCSNSKGKRKEDPYSPVLYPLLQVSVTFGGLKDEDSAFLSCRKTSRLTTKMSETP